MLCGHIVCGAGAVGRGLDDAGRHRGAAGPPVPVECEVWLGAGQEAVGGQTCSRLHRHPSPHTESGATPQQGSQH